MCYSRVNGRPRFPSQSEYTFPKPCLDSAAPSVFLQRPLCVRSVVRHHFYEVVRCSFQNSSPGLGCSFCKLGRLCFPASHVTGNHVVLFSVIKHTTAPSTCEAAPVSHTPDCPQVSAASGLACPPSTPSPLGAGVCCFLSAVYVSPSFSRD